MKTPDISNPMKKNMIGQLFMIGISGDTLTREEEKFISENNIGFIILFSRNTKDTTKVKALTKHIHKLGTIKPLIFIDQEGGPVVRFGEKTSTFISHMGLAATGKPEYARFTGKIIGYEMNSMGIDGIFAPVLDVNTEKNNPVIGIRSFSDNKRIVSKFGASFINGLREGGVIPCPKHFPGHGNTSEDSHLTLPVTDISEKELIRTHIHPYKKAFSSGVDAIMTAHVIYSSIDNNPGTFSPLFLKYLLRDNLNFNGVVFSDCLEMSAIKENYSHEEIIEKGVGAGIDIFSVSHSIDFAKKLISSIKNIIKTNSNALLNINKSYERIMKLKEKSAEISYKSNFSLRDHLEMEQKIAARSITVLKKSKGVLPLNPDKDIMIINMRKSGRSTNFSDGKTMMSFKSIIEKKFKHFKIVNPDKITDWGNFKKMVRVSSNVILINYSFGGKEDIESEDFIKKIIGIRKNIILVAAENPYILRNFKEISLKIATFGSRRIQIEALIDLLAGSIKSTGKFPVKLF